MQIRLFVYLSILFALPLFAFGQKGQPISTDTIYINAKLIEKDSVIVPFDESYILTSDSCTKIIRYGHYNFSKKTFYGKFKDVNRNDTSIVIATGAYTNDGLKSGEFIVNNIDGKLLMRGNFVKGKLNGDWLSYYPNGNLKAKGKFANNEYSGKWELYKENGQPDVFFEVVSGKCKITDNWNGDGIKTVDNGNGYYHPSSKVNTWQGKLVNGLPDSTWSFDIGYIKTTENFLNNKFQYGHAEIRNTVNDYYDKSHIDLLPALASFVLDQANNLIIPHKLCSGKLYHTVFVKLFDKVYFSRTISLNDSSFSN